MHISVLETILEDKAEHPLIINSDKTFYSSLPVYEEHHVMTYSIAHRTWCDQFVKWTLWSFVEHFKNLDKFIFCLTSLKREKLRLFRWPMGNKPRRPNTSLVSARWNHFNLCKSRNWIEDQACSVFFSTREGRGQGMQEKSSSGAFLLRFCSKLPGLTWPFFLHLLPDRRI